MISNQLLHYVLFALLCRDPDTGKFYGINTTWPSTTFCGNYHCKLRKKNFTETEYVPLRQINVSYDAIQGGIPKKERFFNKDSLFQKVAPKAEKINIADINNLIVSGANEKFIDLLGFESGSKEADNDRYLNEKEIKSISSILHTLKKSDLDAIVELYNLAQDIYKEIDKSGPNNLVFEDGNNIKQNMGKQAKNLNIDKQKTSYWYDPMRGDKRFDVAPFDMETLASSKIKLSTMKPSISATSKPPIKSPNILNDVTPTSKEFTKLPYYYPMSTFQRVSSYVHQPVTYLSPYVTSPTVALKPQQDTAKYQKIINPSFYLPYPFSYIPHYNWSLPQNIFYYNRLNLDDSSKTKSPLENAVLINPDLENIPGMSLKAVNKSNKESELSVTPERVSKIKYNHDWQTDPISAQILNEVRAHADKKLFRPISLRKKITLERVRKVINIDELTKRTKRSVSEESKSQQDIFEAFIEKTTCQANETVPGYFRYGNMSRPFPDCCPQRIS